MAYILYAKLIELKNLNLNLSSVCCVMSSIATVWEAESLSHYFAARFHAETNGESPRQVAGQSNHQENEASTPECASENPAAANQAEGMQSFPSPADSAKTANNQDGDQQSDKHTEADSEDNRNASSPARSGSKGKFQDDGNT